MNNVIISLPRGQLVVEKLGLRVLPYIPRLIGVIGLDFAFECPALPHYRVKSN